MVRHLYIIVTLNIYCISLATADDQLTTSMRQLSSSSTAMSQPASTSQLVWSSHVIIPTSTNVVASVILSTVVRTTDTPVLPTTAVTGSTTDTNDNNNQGTG